MMFLSISKFGLTFLPVNLFKFACNSDFSASESGRAEIILAETIPLRSSKTAENFSLISLISVKRLFLSRTRKKFAVVFDGFAFSKRLSKTFSLLK